MKTKPRQGGRVFLNDAVDMVGMCVQALESDNFSLCFRTVHNSRIYRSGVLYVFSFIVRYFMIFPLRFAILFVGGTLISVIFLLGVYLHKERVVSYSFKLFFRLLIFVFNCRVKHYGEKKRIKEPHVYVANHTSFIDFVILSSYKFCHACIAESHGGLFGFVFNTLLSKNGSIAFKRSDKNDRESTLRRVREHVRKNEAPMLIFPEGTVVNNEYIVMFQKGAFELDVLVCPVGIKYRKNLMDPYWNRRNSCFTLHLFYLITRWRIDVDVHWMAPVRRRREESSVSFSYRVKNLIARKTGLRNTLWNGYFKSSPIMRDLILFRTAYCNIYKRQNESLFERNKNVATARGHLHLLDESIYRRKTDSRVYLNGITYDMFVNECCKEYIRLKAHYFTIKQQSASFLNVGTVDAV